MENESAMPPGAAEFKASHVVPIEREFYRAVEQGGVTKDLSRRYLGALEAYEQAFYGARQDAAKDELRWIEAEKAIILRYVGRHSGS